MKINVFDVYIDGHDKPKHYLKSWRNTYIVYGGNGLLEEQRGKGSTGRLSGEKLSTKEKLKRA